jgi:hypothetical protein
VVGCPSCQAVQIVFVAAPRRSRCFYCGASWVQGDNEQTVIERPETSEAMEPAQAAPVR